MIRQMHTMIDHITVAAIYYSPMYVTMTGVVILPCTILGLTEK